MNNNNNQYPSKVQQAKNIAKTVGQAAWGAAKGEGVFVSQDVKETRMNICKSCTYYNRAEGRCRHCGCYLESKTSLKASKCPIDKWGFDFR